MEPMGIVYSFCLYALNLIKMQILLCIGKALAISVSLATIGVCVFCASASVGAFFTFKEILCMKKKLILTVLCLVIILSLGCTVFANENVTVKYQYSKKHLTIETPF